MSSKTLLEIRKVINSLNNNSLDEISLWKDEAGTCYVRYPANRGQKLSKLSSEDFTDWLFVNQAEVRTRNGGSEKLPLSAFKSLVDELVAKAKYDEEIPETKLLHRAGYYGDKLYLCLYSKARRVVEISAQGWQVIDEAKVPVLFVPNETALELPEPQRGGSLQLLRDLLNLEEDNFRQLVLWLMAVLNPSIVCPILSVSAGYVAGKTTLTRFVKSLIDPDNAGELAPFNKEDDLYAASSSRYIICVDNVSKITKKWSDMYCRLTTGAGAVKRRNYTNNDAFNLRVRNPLILNGIDFDPAFPDLRDRCLFLKLGQLQVRKSGRELEEEFEAVRSQILGALLDAVIAALGNTSYRLDRDINFRMLDTAEFVMRAADAGALPFSTDELQKTLEARNVEVKDDELMNDTVARAVYEIINESGIIGNEIEFLSSELWEEVIIKAKQYAKVPKDVPSTNASFGKRLVALTGLLKANGISVRTKHLRKGTKVWLKKIADEEATIDATASVEQDTASEAQTTDAEPVKLSEASTSREVQQTQSVAEFELNSPENEAKDFSYSVPNAPDVMDRSVATA